MLEYLLREAAVGIRIMAKDRTDLHMFDIGKDPAGQEWVFLMLVVKKEIADKIPTKDSDPKTLEAALLEMDRRGKADA
jgi:hypothetical protein